MIKKIVFLFLIFILIIIIFFGIIRFYQKINYIDRSGAYLMSNSAAEATTEPFFTDSNIEQEIFSTRNNLSKIIIPLKLNGSAEIQFSLLEKNAGQLLRQTKIDLKINQSIDWAFEPIADSQGKNYNLQIKLLKASQGLCFFTIPPDRFDGGKLIINGRENSEERFVIDWQHKTTNALSTAFSRLAYGKPGIFNHAGTYLFLSIILLLLIIMINWLILKVFWGNTDGNAK